MGSLGDTVSAADSTITPKSAGSRGMFDELDLGFVTELYKKVNPLIVNIIVNSIFVKYTSLSLRGKSYSCSQASRKKGSQFVALAEWVSALFGPPPTPVPEPTHPDSKFRPVKIHHYIRVSATADESVSHLLLAVVSWHLPHPNRDVIGKPAQVWNHSKFERGGIYTF